MSLFHNSNIDFSTAVGDYQLEQLAKACQQAAFGAQKLERDESCRRAGKMDAVNFSTNFNPNDTGIMEGIRGLLLKNPESSIQVESPELNV